ncbi:MAG: hypothetical protein MUC49_22745, partial [Raineya sp.]|nr:hypothetical protein [Raineya sp.]
KAVSWFVMYFDRIVMWVKSVLDSIVFAATGAIGDAMKSVEEAMGRSVGLVITFLASQLGLGKIGEAIKDILKKVRQPIEKIVNKVVNWIADKVKKLMRKVRKLWDKDGKDKKRRKHEKEDHGKDEVKQEDKKKHEAIYREIRVSLKEPIGEEVDTFEKFYQLKTSKAKKLESKYQNNLSKGIKIDINFDEISKGKKDENIEFSVRIAPNNLFKTLILWWKDFTSTKLSPQDLEKLDVLIYKALGKVAKENIPSENQEFTDKYKKDILDEGKTKVTLDENGKLNTSAEKSKKEKELKEEKEELAKQKAGVIRKEILEAQLDYKYACKQELYPNNVFEVNNKKLFVATQNNFYIVPDIEGDSETKDYDYFLKISKEESFKNYGTPKSGRLSTEQILKKIQIKSKIKNKEEVKKSIKAQENNNAEERLAFILQKPEIFAQNGIKIDSHITIGVSNSGKYSYHLAAMSKTKMREWYKNFPLSINDYSVETITFLAAVLAEPSRYSIGFITNLLAIDESNNILEGGDEELKELSKKHKEIEKEKEIVRKKLEKDNTNKELKEELDRLKANNVSPNDSKHHVFRYTSMTQKDSDQKDIYSSKYNTHQREIVINRDINIIKGHQELYSDLKIYYQKNRSKSDDKNISIIAHKILNYLKLKI